MFLNRKMIQTPQERNWVHAFWSLILHGTKRDREIGWSVQWWWVGRGVLWISESAYVLIKGGGHENRHLPSNGVFHRGVRQRALSVCSGWRGAEVSSQALTSLEPFLWQTFVTLRRAVCCNRLLTTSAAPSLRTAQLSNTATFAVAQKKKRRRGGTHVIMNGKLIL